MKKINANLLCVSISAVCFIEADKLKMYNYITGQTKSYKDIDESDDMGNWVIKDSAQVFKDCDELEHDNIEIEAA